MSSRLQRHNRAAPQPRKAQPENRLSIPNTGARAAVPPFTPAAREIPTSPIQAPLASLSYTADHLNKIAARYSRVADRYSSANAWGRLLVIVVSLVWIAGLGIGFQAALSVQFILALLMAALGLAFPALGVIAVGLLAAIDAMAVEYLLTGGVLRFNTVNYLLLLVLALHLPFVLRLRDFPSRVLQIFLILITLEISFSLDILEGMQDALNIVATFGMLVYFAKSLKDELSLYWLGVVTGVMGALGGLVYFLQFDALPYANPNNWVYFNITALFSICISFPYARAFNKSKLILIFLTVINVVWVFLSASRGGILLASICVLYLFLNARSLTWSTLMIAVGLAVGLWLSSQFIERQLYSISRIELLLDPTVDESRRTSQRSDLVEAGLAIFQENPLGVGTGSFRHVVNQTGLFSRDKPSHSGWIKTLAENGIPGIILLTTFVASYFIMGLRKHREGKLLFGLFITLAIATAFISKEFQGKSHWYLAAAGIVLLNPQETLEHLKRKLKPNDIDYRQRLREVRFGGRRH